MAEGFRDYIENYLNDLKTKRLYRNLSTQNKSLLNFSSNDYLDLSSNPDSIAAGHDAARLYGSGSTGSRLLSGNVEIFEKFEKRISADKNFGSSLIFNSGFIANSSVISGFCLSEAILIFDKLNHASMYHGINATANVKLVRYKHLNYNELEDILKKYDSFKHKLIASETVFGMDGDMADLEALSYLSRKYGALLFLDEAHATGLHGKNGHGLSTNFRWDQELTIVMGTFSKALASSGAYVAGDKLLKEYLVNKCKGFIYSTALSPFCLGVALHNWTLLPQLNETRSRIIALSDKFRLNIGRLGYKITGHGTNIVAIIFDSLAELYRVSEKLLGNGVLASLVRPPTSPTPRIRFAVSAAHREEDFDVVLEVLQQ
ncbi:MAG: aminotransferase class I/II-fold pyridoxal phosphate-dependent enzyme [Holosporaceae bacterium]|jgi:8-amino-7-oxononanoate synthase|nr:aminotransferase class I/II-fold pyridoxal phosphate-dependent enzyme [Holosporaceae bacterium]